MKRKWVIGIVFIIVYSVVLYRWYKIPVSDEQTQARIGVYGDAFSSRNVHSAAMWFKDIGFDKTKGLPVFGYKGNFNQQEIGEVYTHYPPLPDLLGGVYARLLSTKEIKDLQLVLIGVSIFFFFFLLKAMEKLLPDKQAAFLSWVFLVTGCYFICWADDLHQHLYTELLKWVYVWILYRYYTEERKTWMLPALAGIYFVQSWLTFESIPFLAVITVGFSGLFSRRLFTGTNFVLLLIPVIGVALHFFQNYLYLGSWEAVLVDMKNAALKRITGGGEWQNELGRKVLLYDYVKLWTYETWFRIGRMFGLHGGVFIPLALFALQQLYRHQRTHFYMALLFLAAGISWMFVMPQHAMIHTFTIKHWAFFMAFVFGYGLNRLPGFARQTFRSGPVLHKAGFLMAGTALLLSLGYNLFYYVYLKFGFAYPYFGTDAHLW